MRPVLRGCVGNLEGHSSCPALFLLAAKEHDHNLFRQLVNLYPVKNGLIVAVAHGLRIQRAAHLVHEVPVIQLLAGLFRARKRDLLEVVIGVADGVVARAAHQPLALPIVECALHLLLRHVQIPRHRRKAHALGVMIAEHQAVEIDLHKLARRAQHVFGNKHILNRRGVKQRSALVKRAKRHQASPPQSQYAFA